MSVVFCKFVNYYKKRLVFQNKSKFTTEDHFVQHMNITIKQS